MTILLLSKVTNLGALTQIQTLAEHQLPCSRFVDIEQTGGRTTCRIVNVFTDLDGIDCGWSRLRSLIQVERIGIRSGKQYLQINYYISSLVPKATIFAQGIRQHWGIENRLHWGGSATGGFPDLWRLPLKDVVFGEDTAPFTNYNAAINWSIIRTIAINLARMSGYDSLTKATRFLAHDIDKLFSILE